MNDGHRMIGFHRPVTEEDRFKQELERKVRERLHFIAYDRDLHYPAEIQGYRKALEWVLRDVLGVPVI